MTDPLTGTGDEGHPSLFGAPITDGLVTLRAFEAADAPTLIAGRDAEFERFLSDASPDPRPTACIVVDGRIVGWIDFDLGREWLADDEANVGYSVFADDRGKGYASRALELLVSTHLVSRHEVAVATLLIDEANAPSLGVAARTGFVDHGIVEGERFFKRTVR